MFDKLDFITEKYDELAQKVSDPEVINNQPVWQKHVKEMGEMEPIVKKYKEYKKAKADLADAKEILEEGDEEMRELAKMEISELEELIGQQEDELKVLLLPKDPNDEKNVILEIRAGTGGEEAALFAADLFRMYSMYGEKQGWRLELTNVNQTELGGVKELSCLVKGETAYARLKHESGVHRRVVQQIGQAVQIGLGFLVLPVRFHKGEQVFLLFVQAGSQVRVVIRLRLGELGLDLFQAQAGLGELRPHYSASAAVSSAFSAASSASRRW